MATYDFIVVGSGPSGAIIAFKLARSAERPTVLLLEAGTDGLIDQSINARFITAKTKPEINWGYQTVPQNQLAGQQIDYSRGKALGGTTNINFGMWNRPSRGDFEEWAERVGDEYFGWESANRHLDAIEWYGPTDGATLRVSGGDQTQEAGRVPLYFSSVYNEANEALINGFVKHGTVSNTLNLNISSGNPIGTGVLPVMAKDGIFRATAATVYLSNPPTNLDIETNSQVSRILFNEAKSCIGVETITGLRFLSKKDTIICCGALDTPKLLMLSGIGPKDHLLEVGLGCINDLPGVGSILKDHPLNVLLYETNRSLEPDIKSIVASFFRDEFLLTSDEAATLPLEEKRLLARPTVPTYEVASAFNFPPGVSVSPPNVAFFAFNMTPQSSGTVRLASASPEDSPLCDPKFHAHPYDRKNAIVRTRMLLDVVERRFSEYIKRPISAPASRRTGDINAWLNSTLSTGCHMACTVKMGAMEDGMACVDSFFKVRGVNGLRVADLSVCPLLTSGHPTSVAYLVGSWAAERIAAEHCLSL